MFAAQLIRILNTLPTHSSNETCVLDADELKGNMKENHNGILFNVNSPPRYPLATGINDKDGFWNTPELECAMVVDSFTDVKGNELKKPLPQLPLEYFEKDVDMYMDKNVMECDLPELMICYKESGSYHVVKDICVDEGIPVEEKIVLDSTKDNHGRAVDSFSLNGDTSDDTMKESSEAKLMEDESRSLPGHDCVENAAAECGTKEKWDDDLLMKDGKKDIGSSLPTNDHSGTESVIQDVSESSLRKDCEYAANDSGTQQGTDNDLFNPDGIRKLVDDNDDEADLKCGSAVASLLEPNTEHGGAGDDGQGNQVQDHEDSLSAIDKLKDAPLAEELDSNSIPPVKVYRPLTSLKILLKSSEFGVDDDSEELHDQTPVAELSEVPAVVSGTEVSSSDQASILLDNREVVSGNITLNFDAEKVAAVSEDESFKNCHDLLLESDYVSSKNDHYLLLRSETLPSVDGNLENLTKASHVQHAEGDSSFTVAGPISGLVTDTALNHDDVTSDFTSMARLLQRGDGESSFSVGGPVSGRINYSGPIPFSGSISLRSESSTTSTLSFAFPVLPNEWNSSPVRMAKADRRHYRKHRGWRLGIPCCKF